MKLVLAILIVLFSLIVTFHNLLEGEIINAITFFLLFLLFTLEAFSDLKK